MTIAIVYCLFSPRPNAEECDSCEKQEDRCRAYSKDTRAAQVAADLEINPICRDAGFALPAEAIFPGEGEYAHCPPGKTMEEYYVLVQQEQQEGSQSDDGEGNDPGGCGGVMPAPDQASAEHSANSWKGRVAAAQPASQRGELPGSLQRWVERILKPRVPANPWRIDR